MQLSHFHRKPFCCVAWILFWGTSFGCSAWIDDFEVGHSAADVETETNTGGDSDLDTDSDSDGGVETEDSGDCREEVVKPAGDTLVFCRVDGGAFHLGCLRGPTGHVACLEDELPSHPVSLSSFSIGRYEVSAEQYAGFVAEEPDWAPVGALAEEK